MSPCDSSGFHGSCLPGWVSGDVELIGALGAAPFPRPDSPLLDGGGPYMSHVDPAKSGSPRPDTWPSHHSGMLLIFP